MRRLQLVTLFLAFAALVTFFCASAWAGAETVPIGEPESERVVSQDSAVDSERWLELVTKYSNPYALSGDVAPGADDEVLASWWRSLGDETLTQLVSWALMSNRDLEAANARVTEARAALGISKAAVLPWLDSVDSWTNSQTSDNGASPGGSSNLYRLGVDASWEIDIFGGQRRKIEAAEADLAATHAALHSTWVTLSSEVALNYLTVRTLQHRLAIAEQNLLLQQDTLDMVTSQYESGLTDALALNQSLYTVEQTRASIPPIKSQIERTLNALAILVGSVPGSLGEMIGEQGTIPQPNPAGLVGIPAETLRRRPDIRAAEMQMVAQIARTKAARTDLLPKFHLIGSIGIESLSTGSLFSGDSYFFGIGPRITWPIFHGGAIRKNIAVQSAREEQYLAAYEQTVLSAVAEVRDALTANAQELERNKSLAAGVEAARQAVEVAQDRYRNGLSDFNNVIITQRALLLLEEEYAISEGEKTSNIVRLFKALGGGWQPLLQAENAELASDTASK